MEISLPVAALIALGTSLVTAGVVFGVMRNRIDTLDKDVRAADSRIADARALAVKALGDLADFKVEAAKQFVTDEMLAKVEERVVAAIDRLADRLDRILEARGRRPGQN